MTKSFNIFTMSERINRLAENRGLSLSGLSRVSGLGKGTISDMLQTPDRSPRPSTMLKIAKALDVDVKYILGETDEEGVFTQEIRGMPLTNSFSERIHPFNDQRKTTIKDGSGGQRFEVSGGGGLVSLHQRTFVTVDTSKAATTGDTCLARFSNDNLRIVYLAEPYVFWIEHDGTARHSINGSGVEILGRITATDPQDEQS